MSAQLATLAYLVLILVLLLLDRKRRTGISGALWLVVIWVGILASKRLSLWFGGPELPESEADGSALDRNVFLLLIVSALYVLKRRQLNWRQVISSNRWVFFFYLFFGLSAFWSDFPFVAFKRWFRDFGNIVMILVVLTEADPIEAVRAVFVRCACVLLPLSVLFNKYYGALARGYNQWTGEGFFHGVAQGKNQLGALILVAAIVLVWEMSRVWRDRANGLRKADFFSYLLLLAMAFRLLIMAKSATSLACTVLASFALVALNINFVRHRLRTLLIFGALVIGCLALLSTVVDLKASIAEMLGRDPTLHGRDQIWQAVLAEPINPVLGTGFNSFWMSKRPEHIQQKTHQFFLLNQAHNGYLEMYLTGGIIGEILLMGMLFTAGKRLLRQLFYDADWAGFRLVFLVAIMIHNWSEATFCRESPLWFVLLLVIFECPRVSNEFPKPQRLATSIDSPVHSEQENVPVAGAVGGGF